MTHKQRLDDNSKGPGAPWPDTGSLLYYSTRSKSTSCIPAELEQEARWKLRCVELQKIRDQAKEIEEQWRHDLARWRSHRWSVSSNFVRERREQERAEPASRGNAGKFNTCSKMHGGKSRDTDTPASTGVASLQTPQAAASKLQPRSISLPPRSYPVDSAYGSVKRAVTPPTTPVLLRTSPEASISNRICSRTSIVCADQTETTLKQRTSTSAVRTAPQQTSTNRTSTSFATVTSTALTGRTSASLPDLPGRFPADPRGTTVVVHSGASSAYKAPDTGLPIGRPEQERSLGPLHNLYSMDTKPAATQVTTSLPRSSWRSDSSRLASVVSPRPFGTQSTRIAPVSRVFTMDDSHGPFNGEKNPSQNSTVLEHQRRCPNPGNEVQSQPRSILKIKKDTEAGSTQFPSPPSPLPFPQINCQSKPTFTAAEASDAKIRYEAIRIRLTCTKSSLDFGFEISRHPGGIFIESIQQGSPAELCQLHVGDEIVALDGHRASEMSGGQWKASLDSALQHNNLVLDIKRMAQNGSSKEYINFSDESISQPPSETAVKSTNTVNSQAISDVAGMNGGFHHESLDSKESESLSLKNLKRRSEFFEQQGAPGLGVSSLVYLCGGSESAISDLSIPSIAASSTRHSWDLNEERKRHEKWQQEQERLLQEKYKRDQQKLDDEWRQAQKDAVREGSGNLALIFDMDSNSEGTQPQVLLEVDRSFSTVSSASTLSRATPPPPEELGHPEDDEESGEMGEILLLGPASDNEGVEKKEASEELGLQKNGEKVGQKLRLNEEEDSPMCQQATDTCPAETFDLHVQDLRRGNGFAEFSPEISLSDRAKSQSTPELDEVEKPEVTANSSGASKPIIPANQESQEKKKTKNKKKKGRPLSQVEMDRLQILEEMKKRTPLLTDTSWIRQRSTNIYREPIHLGGGMRRYESLDNLNSARSWKQSPQPASHVASTSSCDRPNSALSNAASSPGYTRSLSSTLPTSFSMGSLRQSLWSQPSPTSPTPNTPLSEESAPEPHRTTQHSNSASTASLTSGDQSLELEPERKSDCETGNSTASPSTPNSQMDCPSPCDLTTLLQGEEETTPDENV